MMINSSSCWFATSAVHQLTWTPFTGDPLVLSASYFDPKEIKGQSLQTQFTVLPPSESSHIAIVLLR